MLKRLWIIIVLLALLATGTNAQHGQETEVATLFLATSGLPESYDPAAAAYIKPLLEDEDENVREVARESLE